MILAWVINLVIYAQSRLGSYIGDLKKIKKSSSMNNK